MARSKAELEKLMADLQAELEDADDDDDLVIETKDGHIVRLKGDTKQKYLRKHGLIFDDEETEEPEEVVEIPKTTKRVVKKAATPVKRATSRPAKVVEETLDEIDDELEEESDVIETPKGYWG